MTDWKWFGHAGHFIASRRCRFHMTTIVGPWLISTVGDYHPHGDNEPAQEIGLDRLYETMVFEVVPGTECKRPECMCGLPQVDWSEGAMEGYNLPGDAQRGHLAMCKQAEDSTWNPGVDE